MSVLLVCSLTGLTYFSYFKLSTKLVHLYVIISFFNDCLGYYCLYYSSEKRVQVFGHNLYVCIYFCILTLYFFCILKYKYKTFYLIVSVVVFIVSFIFSIKTIEYTFHYRQFIILSISFILCSILYFKQLLDTEEEIFKNSNFWIVTGILFFHSGYFFLSGLISFIANKDIELARKIFTINHLLNIVYYSLITYGFICQRKLAKSSS